MLRARACLVLVLVLGARVGRRRRTALVAGCYLVNQVAAMKEGYHCEYPGSTVVA